LKAAEWWKDVVCAAEAWYKHHMSLSPLVTSPGAVSEKQNLLRNLEDPPENQNVLDGPIALRT